MAEVEPLDPAEVEFVDPYTYDEEQPYLMLISTSVNTLCFPCEEDYSIADCKNILAFKYPEKLPLGSFEISIECGQYSCARLVAPPLEDTLTEANNWT